MFRFRGGRLDEHLVKDYDGFPMDSAGNPTFRPSAHWYLNQLEFPNGRDLKVLESKVTDAGDDLKLIKRVEGEFFECFELQRFPFDVQDLGVTISINCATDGPVPVVLQISPSVSCGVNAEHFAYKDVWALSSRLALDIDTVGATSERRFPAILLRALVKRRPGFIIINVALPSLVIAMLPQFVFFVEVELVSDKLSISVAILLTAVALKFATAQYLPQIPYLTLVDKFVLTNSLIIVIATVFNAVLGCLVTWAKMEMASLHLLGKIFYGTTCFMWIACQVYFARLAMYAWQHLAHSTMGERSLEVPRKLQSRSSSASTSYLGAGARRWSGLWARRPSAHESNVDPSATPSTRESNVSHASDADGYPSEKMILNKQPCRQSLQQSQQVAKATNLDTSILGC
eukprot:CAMPEP_0119344888 /NCGR_PEP_ID=MMETSP1333-20130426/107201_1 /TAXON_ID=418940 /ORGANISM="Scyphosphaera apsteinii, Strain RCC1455" /LENGTH=400 /DNA_ID=CAMNT_0007357337 /DNA_START=684 /DNA_END=1886 /DNA_ORIENTATION=-